MNKFRSFIAILLLSFNVMAQDEEAAKPEPLDPAYMGVHGMVVVNNGSRLFASHLPLYHKPHNAQIIYKLDSKSPALTYLVRDADLVTIKPERFNLQHLIRGEELSVKVDVYMGHFERGGMLTYEDVEVTFSKQVYLRMLTDIENASIKQTYDSVPLRGNARLLIHQIQSSPSFDHIVLFYENLNCVTEFNTSSSVPAQNELISRLSICGSMKPLYFETQDFRSPF